MSLKVINFDLNFIPTGVPPIVYIHQYDLGEIVALRPTLYYRDELYNGMNLEKCDFIVAYQRPDGSQQSYTIENHVFLDEYVFEFPLDANMTAMHGPNVMSLGFVDRTTNNILWTQNFILFVERHPIQSEDYMGSSVYDGMLRLLQRYVDEAYAATPPGYEEHVAKIQEVERTIDALKEDIRENLEDANEYTDQQMASLDSVYATLQDVVDAQNEGRAYAGQLIGDTETRINSDMALMYQTKDEASTDKTNLQIYAEQVSESSATEVKEYLGLDYNSSEPGLTETGLLNTVITRTAESIVSEATAEFMTESEADGIITSRVNSKVEQKANEITTTVAQLYETKEDANRKLSDAQSYARSQISQKAGEITTTVKAYTDETISNLKIGAQNLLRGTNEYKTTDESDSWVPTYNNGGWKASGTVTASELDDNPGNGFTVGAKIQNGRLSQNSIDFLVDKKAYVVHMYLKGSGLPDPHGEKAAIDSALKNIVYFRNTATGNKLVLDYATETDQETGVETVIRNQSFNYHYPYKEVVTYPTYTEEDEQGNQVTKVRKQVDYVEITDSPWRELEWYILCDEWPENVDVVVDSTNGTLDVCGIKMEEGSKATAWQPNEFDIKKYTNTQIQQTNERISLIAEAQDTTDENVSNMSSRLDVEAGKIAAMVAAGFITEDEQQGWTSSYSTQQENRIMNQVSSAYATKNRVNEVESKIVTTDTYTQIVSRAVSGIKIGGENLIRSTELVSETVSSANATWALADAKNGWYKQGNNDITLERINVNNAPSNGIRKGWRFTHSGNITSANHATVAQYSVPVTYQQEYTISFYARLVSGAARAFCQTYISASGTHTHTQSFDELTSDWKRCVFTFTHDFENSRNQTGIYFGIEWDASVAGVIEICGLKLELGNVATDWCPSVYDMEAYTQASLTVATDSITATVSKMSVGGVNMLQDVNASSLTKVNAAHNRYFSDSSVTEVTPTMVEISDPPNGVNISYGARFVVSSVNTSKGRRLCWYSGGVVPFVDGETYTVSCYGRIVSGDTMRVSFQFGTSAYKGTTIDSISGEWARYMYSFTYNKSDYGDTNGVGTRVYIGVIAAYTGTFELCGFQCEKGTFATAFSEESVTPSNIISRINQTAESVTIDASKINFNGSTFFTNLQSEVQNAVSGSIKRIYYRTTTNSQPSAPSSGVTTGITSTSDSAGGWRTIIPTFSPGNTYYWTCEEYKKNDDKFYYTNVSPFHATIVDGANIYAGSITLTKFDSTTQNTISTASSDASTAKSDAATAKTTAENAVTRYGQCTTDAGTAAKTVTLTTGKLGTLAAGAVVSVYFTKANSAATPTLNVNNTGAKQIRMVHGTAWTSGSNWKAGAVLTFTYDGTYWIVTNGSQTKDAYDKANTAATNASDALTKANKAVVESVTVYYCYDSTAPTQPTDTEITETSSAVDQWTLRMPDPVYNGYYYECTQQKLNDGTFTFTEMRRMSFTEGIAKWISTNDATKIDGGHIYTKSVDTGALNLYGLLQINQSSSGTVGGYIGFESGVTLTNGDYAPTDGFRLYSSNKSHYIHTSTDGIVIHANNYLQLYNSGSQRTHMYTDTGMDFRTINDSTGDPQLLSVSKDGSSRKPLTIGASYLYFDAYNDYSYFKSWGGTYTHTIASDVTTSYKLQIGHSSRLAKFVGSLDSGSDIRLKENVDYNGVPDVIDNFKVCSFVYKNDENKRVRYGLIAQDVLTVDQNLVDYDCDETGCTKPSKVEGEEPVYAEEAEVYFTLRYTDIIPMLIQKCQKLQKQINELKEAPENT